MSLQNLPDNKSLWPPIAIRCVDCRKFGREVLVGTHIVNHVIKYFHEEETTDARKLSSNLSGIIGELNKNLPESGSLKFD